MLFDGHADAGDRERTETMMWSGKSGRTDEVAAVERDRPDQHTEDRAREAGRHHQSGTGDVHGRHEEHGGPGGAGGHDMHAGHDKHAGHDPEMFRRRFWLSLLLTLPIVVTSEVPPKPWRHRL
jgi:Cu2+-exporting ATPase